MIPEKSKNSKNPEKVNRKYPYSGRSKWTFWRPARAKDNPVMKKVAKTNRKSMIPVNCSKWKIFRKTKIAKALIAVDRNGLSDRLRARPKFQWSKRLLNPMENEWFQEFWKIIKFPENGNCENPYRIRSGSTCRPPTRATETPMAGWLAGWLAATLAGWLADWI